MLECCGFFGRETGSGALVLCSLEISEETLLGGTALVVAILRFVHGELEQFLIVLTAIPTVFFHLLDEAVELVGIVRLGVFGAELVALFLGQLHNFGCQFAGQLTALAQDHTPDGIVHHGVAGFVHRLGEKVHQSDVLHILAEGRYEGRIAHARPNVGHFVEEFHEEGIFREGFFALLLTVGVDGFAHTGQVGHHRAHHTAGQTATEQERRHEFVAGVDEVAQPLVDELLGEFARLHVGVHIDLGHVETGVLEHALHRDHVGMHLTPSEGLNGGVDNVATVAAHLEDRSHRQTGAGVAVVFDDYFGVLFLDHAAELTEHRGLSDTGHVLEADLGCAGFDELIGDAGIVFGSVNRRSGDAQRGLGRHAAFDGIFDRGDDVAHIVQTAEDTRDVGTLRVLDFIHEATHVGGHGEHAQSVQTAVEHVGFDAHFVEGFRKSAYGLVGILAGQQVDLFKGATIGLHTGEAAHFNDDRSDAFQLILTRLEFAGALEHVAIDKRELNFSFFHIGGYLVRDEGETAHLCH